MLPRPEQGKPTMGAGSQGPGFLPPSHSGPAGRLCRALGRCLARVPWLLPAWSQRPGMPLHMPSPLCPGEGVSPPNKGKHLRAHKARKTSQAWLLALPKLPPAHGGQT